MYQSNHITTKVQLLEPLTAVLFYQVQLMEIVPANHSVIIQSQTAAAIASKCCKSLTMTVFI